MAKIEIIPVTPENYHKCGNVWNMEKTRQTAEWLEEIKSGNRTPYAYTVDGAFLGEIALVKENGDPDYTIPGRRIYVSRLVVKKGYRGQGIGTILVDFIIEKARELGYTELSIGVDKDNKQLRKAIAGALDQLEANGVLDIIMQKWVGGPLDISNAKLTESAKAAADRG
jgi:GNAT superfamily N-acetyltransferase